MTRRNGRRVRVRIGLVLIALGIAVGVLAYLVGRSDDEAKGAGAGAPKGELAIHGTGDVSLDPSYIPALASNGYGWAWSGLDGLFRRDDLTVINHECPSTDIVAPVVKRLLPATIVSDGHPVLASG
jgi:hypothetical protein